MMIETICTFLTKDKMSKTDELICCHANFKISRDKRLHIKKFSVTSDNEYNIILSRLRTVDL